MAGAALLIYGNHLNAELDKSQANFLFQHIIAN
jgi:hypothetical protein